MKKTGFSLIELVIALFISAIVTLMLYRSLNQTQRITKQISSTIDLYSDLLIVENQVEKDFSTIISLDNTTTSTGVADQSKGLAGLIAPQIPPQQPVQKKETTEVLIFKGTQVNDRLEKVTFLSTNALSVLDEVTSRIVRITYELIPQKHLEFGPLHIDTPALFTLMRTEIPFMHKEKKEEPGRAYALLRNIQTCTISYSIRKPEKPGSKKETVEFITLTQWGTDTQKKQIDAPIPQFITLTGNIMHPVTQQTLPFNFTSVVVAARCGQLVATDTKTTPTQTVVVQPVIVQVAAPPPQEQNVVVISEVRA